MPTFASSYDAAGNPATHWSTLPFQPAHAYQGHAEERVTLVHGNSTWNSTKDPA
jgi:hypothetical protein